MTLPVQKWFDDLHPDQIPHINTLRKLILAASPDFREELKWGQPCYSIDALTCYLAKAKTHVTLGFQQGAHLPDPFSLLVGDGPHMRHIKINLNQQMNESAISALLQHAIDFDAK